MSEFITVQVGQCGNQIGSAFWPLALQEHGVDINGELFLPHKTSRTQQSLLSDAFHSFFAVPENAHELNFKNVSDLEKAKVKARAVCIDMEDSVVSRFRSGKLKNLFDDKYFVTNYPGSGNNWAEGHYTYGHRYRGAITNTVRKAVERCDSLHGFLLLFSLGGGTGSGLGSYTLTLLEEHFPDVERFVSCVYPAGSEDVVTAPYNTALATRVLSEYASCVFPVHNKALTEICSYNRKAKSAAISPKHIKNHKYFRDMNSIVVNMLLNLTSGSRFPGCLNVDVNELATNLVPFPKLQYVTSSMSPVVHHKIPAFVPAKCSSLLTEATSRRNQLLQTGSHPGMILSAALVARGAVSLHDSRTMVGKLCKQYPMAPWGKDCVKVGLCSVPASGVPASLLCLLNTSSTATLFQDVAEQVLKLYRRKAHVHHYLQVPGCEESDFSNSLKNLQDTASHYSSVETIKPINIHRLQPL